MAMRPDKVTKRINLSEFPDWEQVPASKREEVKAEVSEFIIDSILEAVASQRTPVAGGKYKKGLSPAYREFKKTQSSSVTANMELTGDMLDSLTWEDLGGNSLEVGFFDPTEAAKAHGHTTGARNLPKRQIIPSAKENFKRRIDDGIKGIVAEFAEEKKPVAETDEGSGGSGFLDAFARGLLDE